MITIDKLKAMKPHTIFAVGHTVIPHPWYGQSEEYQKTVKVKWVAIRGGIHDWAIYHSFHTNIAEPQHQATDWDIADNGQKLHDMQKVVELVPADDEALKMYRH